MTEIRDFDAEVQAQPHEQFRLGGETFTLRQSVRPESLIAWSDLDPKESTAADTIGVIDDLMRSLLIPADSDKWLAVRRIEGEGEIGLAVLTQVVEHAIAAVSGRPTSAPSPSGPGRNGTGTSSTDDSPPRGLISVASPSEGS